VIDKRLLEARVHNLWKIVRWLVMGSTALTWVVEFKSVMQGIPADLVYVIVHVLIKSKRIE